MSALSIDSDVCAGNHTNIHITEIRNSCDHHLALSCPAEPSQLYHLQPVLKHVQPPHIPICGGMQCAQQHMISLMLCGMRTHSHSIHILCINLMAAHAQAQIQVQAQAQTQQLQTKLWV
jgi:hypothetical protein